MNIITQSQFDETKLNFKQVPQMNDTAQYTILFNYKFQSGEDHALILTDPIKVRGNGISKIDGMYKTHDNKCLDFFLNLDEPDGQLLKTQIIDKIDSKFIHLCGNNNSSVNVGTKVIKKCSYILCHRTYNGNHNFDEYNDNEDDPANMEDDPANMISRFKIQIDTVYQPGHQNDVPKEIKTRVFLPVDKTVPIEDREFKDTPEIVTCLNDLRELFHVDCTVRLVLKINRFWIQKHVNGNQFLQCGITFKCMQIYILNDPKWYTFHQNKPIIIPGIKIAPSIKKYEVEIGSLTKCDALDDESEEEIEVNHEKSIYEFDDDEESEEEIDDQLHLPLKNKPKNDSFHCK